MKTVVHQNAQLVGYTFIGTRTTAGSPRLYHSYADWDVLLNIVLLSLIFVVTCVVDFLVKNYGVDKKDNEIVWLGS